MLKYIFLLFIIILCIILNNFNNKLFEKYSNNVNMVICGCARDNGKYLPIILNKIEEITQLCNDYYIIIYENDSKDNTLELLKEFEKKHKNKCHIITETNINKKYPIRTHRLAYARNTILDYLYDNNLDKTHNCYLNMDLDDVNVNLDVNSIKRVFNSDLNWDVVSANQKKKYYDYWALRTEKYNKNCWNNGLCIRNQYLYNWFDTKNKKTINSNEPPLKVLSAFGGLAIYKMDKIKNCRYNGVDNNNNINGWQSKQDCEHVQFHKEIREKNAGDKQYIIPDLLNN